MIRQDKQTFSLRARLALLLALAVLVVFGVAAKIVDWRADTEMQQRFDASLLARAQSLATLTQIENGRIAVDADDAASSVFPGNTDASWYALSCGGSVVARTADVPPSLAADDRPVFADATLPGGRELGVAVLVDLRVVRLSVEDLGGLLGLGYLQACAPFVAVRTRTTAASVPICVIAVNAAPGSSPDGRNVPTMRRWALEEMGRNSVSPSTMPRMSASSRFMRRFLTRGSWAWRERMPISSCAADRPARAGRRQAILRARARRPRGTSR